MKNRSLLSIILTLLMLANLCGCVKFGTEISELIIPPELTGELYYIKEALYSYAGKEITLRYPNSGNWRSAFVINDIDGDGTEDALAFYSTKSQEGATVMHINLITKLEGKWVSVSDHSVESSSVESVEFLNLNNDGFFQVVVRWNLSTEPNDKITVFNFNNGGLTVLYEDSCSVYTVCNIDSSLSKEIMIVSNDTVSKVAKATIYGFVKMEFIKKGETVMDSTVTEYKTPIISSLSDGTPAVYIDGIRGTTGTATEVLFVNSQGMLQNLFVTETSSDTGQTLRISNATCYDFDTDGKPEIPLLKELPPKISGAENPNPLYLTEWQKCNKEGIYYYCTAFMNYADGYSLKIGEDIKGKITIFRGADITERIFHSYDSELEVATEELFRIKTISGESYDANPSLYSEYSLITTRNGKVYLLKINNKNGLGINERTVKENFAIITQ